MKLYYASGACSLASHIALEEAGAAYEAVRVDTHAGDQRQPDYLVLNPKGRVPVLVTDDGVLTENPAILSYVAQAFPAAKLAPLDPFTFAGMQSFNVFLCSSVHVAFANAFRPARYAEGEAAAAALRAKAPSVLRDYFGLVERGMLKGPYVVGDQFTVADAYLYVFAGWLARLDPHFIDEFPRVKAHHARVEARDAVQRVLRAEG